VYHLKMIQDDTTNNGSDLTEKIRADLTEKIRAELTEQIRAELTEQNTVEFQRLNETVEKLNTKTKIAMEEQKKMRSELEIVEFLSYICGADISPLPQIPSAWHTDRSLMRRIMFSVIVEYEKKQNSLKNENYWQSLINRFLKFKY